MLLSFFPHKRIGEFPNRAAFPSRCLLQEENSAFLLRKSVLFRYQTVSFPCQSFYTIHVRNRVSVAPSSTYTDRPTSHMSVKNSFHLML